jgi:hypothetical protein
MYENAHNRGRPYTYQPRYQTTGQKKFPSRMELDSEWQHEVIRKRDEMEEIMREKNA